MTHHALKMLTSFILMIALFNSIYYAVYLKNDPAMRRMNHLSSHRSQKDRRGPNKMKILKVVWMPGPNQTKIKRTVKVYWLPSFSCANNMTKPATAPVTTTETDYRESDDYENTEFERGSICPPVPLLYGPTDWRGGLDTIVMERVFSLLEHGGAYTPTECVTKHYVAVIVPYKGSHGPLLLFLFTLHLALLKQQIYYQVFVVRQLKKSRALNSGKFFNIGFLEAYKIKPNTTWTCFVFHDPYLAPNDARNLYRCSEQPKQLFGVINKVQLKNKFGGVIAMRPEVFRMVNGFSNLYTNTDSIYQDMYDRLMAANYTIEKPSPYAQFSNLRVIRYLEPKLNSNTKSTIPTMPELTSTVTQPQADGLSTLSYTANSELRFTHTLITVDVEKPPIPVTRKMVYAAFKFPTNPPTFSTPTADEPATAFTTTATTKKIISILNWTQQMKKYVQH